MRLKTSPRRFDSCLHIEEKETNKKQRSINIKMPDLAGIYFIKIESDKGVFTSKIIKE